MLQFDNDAAIIGCGRVARDVALAFDSDAAPRVAAYLDRDPEAAAAFAPYAPTAGQHDDIGDLVRRHPEINLYGVFVPPSQVEFVIRPVLKIATRRPVLFLVSAELTAAQLRELQHLRTPQVAFTFRRGLRRAYRGVGRARSIHIHHRPDATYRELHPLIDYALARAKGQPSDLTESRVQGNRVEISLRRSNAPGVLITLAADAEARDLIEVNDEFGTTSFDPTNLPASLERDRELLHACLDVPAIMASGPTPEAIDSYLAGQGLPTPGSELKAAVLVQEYHERLLDKQRPTDS